jgi:hypothetical protein
MTTRPRSTSASDAELARLRDLVADQHRRLRVSRSQEAEPPEIAARFDARCAKPRLSRADLARLIEEAPLRLELRQSSLGATIDAVWPERLPPVPVLHPSPGLVAYTLRDMPTLPNAVFALFGLQGAELRQAVERVVAEQQGEAPFVPIFLTSDPDFTPFRDQRLAFEYIPLICDDEAGAPEPRWVAYLLETLELTLRRWGVRRIIQP